MNRYSRRRRKGFTLMEVIIAVAVVAVLHATEPVSAPEFESTRVLENDLVTVTHTRYPAGATSEMHAHGDRVNVFLTDLAVHVTTGEGEEFEATREVGTAVWSWVGLDRGGWTNSPSPVYPTTRPPRHRPYPSPPTALSRWLEPRIPVPQVAAWAGNTSEVIFKHYCNTTQEYEIPVL